MTNEQQAYPGSSLASTVPSMRIASDLHLELLRNNEVAQLERHFIPRDKRDAEAVLVLAGDISSDISQLAEFLKRMTQRFAQVIYVPGNHEYYRHDYDKWNTLAEHRLHGMRRLIAAIGQVRAVEHDGVRYVCGTLWGDGGSSDAEADAIGNYLNDFRLIGYRNELFKVRDMQAIHNAEKAAIRDALTVDMPTVVITHHMPSYSLSHPRFGNACTGGFAGQCDDLMQGARAPALWIHGHTHDTFDRVIGKTRVVCNPAGYVPEWRTAFNTFLAEPKFVSVGSAV